MSAVRSSSASVRLILTFGGLERRRMKPTDGRQGKRPAFGAAYVVGWIGLFGDIGNMPCWRSARFIQPNQGPERRRTASRPGFRP